MTADFGLGVRFAEPGKPGYTIQPVDNAGEQTDLLRELHARGVKAEPVALVWQVMTDPSETSGGS